MSTEPRLRNTDLCKYRKVIFLNNLKEVVVKNFTFVVKEVVSSNQLICKWTKRVNFLSEDSSFEGLYFFTFSKSNQLSKVSKSNHLQYNYYCICLLDS